MNNQPLIILGMHRSGTTMLTDIINDLGYDIGRFLEGNLEDRYFLNLNNKILNYVGASWDRPFGVRELINVKHDEIMELINSKKLVSHNDKKQLWAFKDPRTVLTFDIWKKIYPNAKIIIVYRNGLDVANSLSYREKKAKNKKSFVSARNLIPMFKHTSELVENREYAFKIWEYYNSILLANDDYFNENSAMKIKYEDFVCGGKESIESLINYLGMNVENYDTDKLAAKFNPERVNAALAGDLSDPLVTLAKSSSVYNKLGY